MSRLRGPVATGVALLLTLVVGIGIGAVAFGGDDDGGPGSVAEGPTTSEPDEATSSSTSSTAPEEAEGPDAALRVSEEGLSGDALELAVALNAARDMNYHARYEATRTDSEGTRTDVVVEVWRRNPLARRDFTVTGGGRQVASREYKTADGKLGCLDTTPDEVDDFACTDASDTSSDPAAPAFGAGDPHSGDVVARDDTVAGSPARCFRVSVPDEAPVDVCFDPAGVPVLVDDGDYRLLRTAVDGDVSDDDFVPPPA